MAKKEKVIKDTAERWLLTYADLMNLLLIFFIILYAISQTDQTKFEQLKDAFAKVLGTYTKATSFVPAASKYGNSVISMTTSGSNQEGSSKSKKSETVVNNSAEKQQLEKVKQKVESIIKKQGLEGNVQVSMQDRGVVISIKAQVLFKPASAVIEANSAKTISKIGDEVLVNLVGKQIKVEGHTDSDRLAPGSGFKDNWDLSGARAYNVLMLLFENPKLSAHKRDFAFMGYGDSRPDFPNNSAVNKKKNRRVNIVIFKDAYAASDASSDTNSVSGE